MEAKSDTKRAIIITLPSENISEYKEFFEEIQNSGNELFSLNKTFNHITRAIARYAPKKDSDWVNFPDGSTVLKSRHTDEVLKTLPECEVICLYPTKQFQQKRSDNNYNFTTEFFSGSYFGMASIVKGVYGYNKIRANISPISHKTSVEFVHVDKNLYID